MKQYLPSFLIFSVFAAVAVILWQTLDNLFYLVNFLYIGTAVSLGSFLYVRKYRHARRIVQLFVGLYMLVYLGLSAGRICRLRASGTICSLVSLMPR